MMAMCDKCSHVISAPSTESLPDICPGCGDESTGVRPATAIENAWCGVMSATFRVTHWLAAKMSEPTEVDPNDALFDGVYCTARVTMESDGLRGIMGIDDAPSPNEINSFLAKGWEEVRAEIFPTPICEHRPFPKLFGGAVCRDCGQQWDNPDTATTVKIKSMDDGRVLVVTAKQLLEGPFGEFWQKVFDLGHPQDTKPPHSDREVDSGKKLGHAISRL